MTTKTNAAPSSEDLQDMVSKALRQAWQLGQTYWQQADSEYASQHRKADVTQAKFDALIDETRASLSTAAQPPASITEQDAYDVGAKGAPATETERLLFEAWMRGHCWSVCGTWDGETYSGSREHADYIDPQVMLTRQIWAAWRDRGSLAAATKQHVQIPPENVHVDSDVSKKAGKVDTSAAPKAAKAEPAITTEVSLRFNLECAKNTIKQLEEENRELRASTEAHLDFGLGAKVEPPHTYFGANVAERLESMADEQPAGSQAKSDLYAAATAWRKHIAPKAEPVQQPEAAGEVVYAGLEYATIKWSKQTSPKGGGDPENSWSWPITGTKVYLQQPERAPLTRKQVYEMAEESGYLNGDPENLCDFINGIRQGEVAHGIQPAHKERP